MIPGFVWRVPGKIKWVSDADTVRCELDLGWSKTMTDVRVRLSNVDAAEIGTPEGDAAKEYVTKLLAPDRVVVVESEELDQFGRVLGKIKLLNGHDVGKRIIKAGHGTLRV